MKMRVARRMVWPCQRMLAQRLNGAPDGIPEADGDIGNIQGDKVVAELAHKVVVGGLPIRNFHELGPVL